MYFSFWQFCFIKNIQLNKSLKLKINAKICDYSENQQDSLPKIVKIVQISMNCFHMNRQALKSYIQYFFSKSEF